MYVTSISSLTQRVSSSPGAVVLDCGGEGAEALLRRGGVLRELLLAERTRAVGMQQQVVDILLNQKFERDVLSTG